MGMGLGRRGNNTGIVHPRGAEFGGPGKTLLLETSGIKVGT
jgi:hypothetical protein